LENQVQIMCFIRLINRLSQGLLVLASLNLVWLNVFKEVFEVVSTWQLQLLC